MNRQLGHFSILVIFLSFQMIYGRALDWFLCPLSSLLGSLAGWQWAGLIIDLRCGPGVSSAHVNQLWRGREVLLRTDNPDE